MPIQSGGRWFGSGLPPLVDTIASLGFTHYWEAGGAADVQLNCASVLNPAALDRFNWARANIGDVLPDQGADPDGGNRAALVSDDATNAAHTLTSAIDNVSTVTVTAKVWAKAGTGSWVYLSLNGGTHRAWFNLATGALGTVSGSGSVGRISAAAGGYWCELDCTYASGSLVVGLASADNTTSYAGSGSTVFLYGATAIQQRVARWFDRVGGLDFTTSAIAEEFMWVPSSANLNNQPGLRGFGASRRMTAGGTSDFLHLHDGTGGTLLVVLNDNGSASNRIIHTNGFSATARGIYLRSTTTTAWDYFIGNGTQTVRQATKSGTPKGLQCVVARYKSGAAPDSYVRSNGAVGTETGANSPSGGAAANGLQLGSTSSSTNGDIALVATAPKDLSVAELAALSGIIVAKYGVAA